MNHPAIERYYLVIVGLAQSYIQELFELSGLEFIMTFDNELVVALSSLKKLHICLEDYEVQYTTLKFDELLFYIKGE